MESVTPLDVTAGQDWLGTAIPHYIGYVVVGIRPGADTIGPVAVDAGRF